MMKHRGNLWTSLLYPVFLGYYSVSELFFLSLGGKVGDLSTPSFQTADGSSENLQLHAVRDTVVNIKFSNFNNVILSGPAVVRRNLE